MGYRFRNEHNQEDEDRSGLLDERELEKLADFYHKNGLYHEAIETLDELLDVRHQHDCQRLIRLRRAS
jgi:hypothetical protein